MGRALEHDASVDHAGVLEEVVPLSEIDNLVAEHHDVVMFYRKTREEAGLLLEIILVIVP